MGNTVVQTDLGLGIEDHPHIHGEYPMDDLGKMLEVGSPPHTWGIPRHQRKMMNDERITPTYMGNTQL